MASRKTLKLATFNVNGIGTRLPHLLAWLDKEAPDIVALQELKAVDEAFPADELEAAGYGALWHGQRSWNGVALLARDSMPVESRRGLPGDLDVYDPKAWRKDALMQPEVREAYFDLLGQGWTDALRHTVGEDEVIYTFWDYFRQHAERDRGLRIDHLLLNPVLAKGLKDAGVDRWVRLQDKASDHAPTWVTVRVPGHQPVRRKRLSASASI